MISKSVKFYVLVSVVLVLAGAAAWFVPDRAAVSEDGLLPTTAVADVGSRPEQGDAARTLAVEPSPTVVPAGKAPAYDASVVEELDGLNLRDQMPALLERAKRDPSLAYALALALGQCALADAAYAALSDSATRMGGIEKTRARMDEFERKFAKCKGLEGKHLELRYDLATRAASAGLLEAQIDYRTLAAEYVLSEEALRRPGVAQQYHDNTVAFTTRAAESGHPDALMAAFRLYSDGMLIPQQKVVAYRYLRAYAQANPSGTAQKSLADFAATLTPDELGRATAQ